MLDWDDLRFFLAVARTGSLSAAARELRCTQTTVGRRIASLEARLGVKLLNRTPRGYVATPAGESIREHVERIKAEAVAIERIVAGRDARLEGKVTVACIESVANNILAPLLPDICGLDATRLLKQDDLTKTIPIIAVTALATPEQEKKALECGCDAYVAKPITLDNLLRTIEPFLSSLPSALSNLQ